jgi:hypothetical protein
MTNVVPFPREHAAVECRRAAAVYREMALDELGRAGYSAAYQVCLLRSERLERETDQREGRRG